MDENNWAFHWTKDQVKSMVLERFAFFWNLDNEKDLEIDSVPVSIRFAAEWMLLS
jgi:hypothetical protein